MSQNAFQRPKAHGIFILASTTSSPQVALLLQPSAAEAAVCLLPLAKVPLYTCCPAHVNATLSLVSILPDVHCRVVGGDLPLMQGAGAGRCTGWIRRTPSRLGKSGWGMTSTLLGEAV